MAQLSYPLDNTEYDAQYPMLWLSTRTNGIFSSDNDLIVTAQGGMRTAVSPGIMWLSPARFTSAVYGNTDTVMFDHVQADGILSRIDRLVVRWDYITNDILLVMKTGQFASSPVPPALQRDTDAWENGIATVMIRPGTLSVLQGDIYDTRLDDAVCGIMRDGVTGIPTAQLQLQWDAWFKQYKEITNTNIADFEEWLRLFKLNANNEFTQWAANKEAEFVAWFETVQEMLSGDVAGQLAAAITALQARVEEVNAVAESRTKTTFLTATLLASAWDSNNEQTIFNAGIPAITGTAGDVTLPQTATEEQIGAAENARLWVFGQEAGKFSVRVRGGVPKVDIPIEIEVRQ